MQDRDRICRIVYTQAVQNIHVDFQVSSLYDLLVAIVIHGILRSVREEVASQLVGEVLAFHTLGCFTVAPA
jgi:hypothetical protein